MIGGRGAFDVFRLTDRTSFPMRLIDLHVDWLLQYAPETVVFDPAFYPGMDAKLGQAEGYLQSTRAAILACWRTAEDWASQTDPWAALGQLITRIQAEFPGRLLIGPDDFDRWLEDRDGLTWGLIGVEGFDSLIRSTADLTRLPRLFESGVRLFQPVYNSTSLLGGSSIPGDDRGLTELGLGFLDALLVLQPDSRGPRPIFDLAHLNPTAASDALSWFEADSTRTRHVIPVYSHGTPAHAGFAMPRAISLENLARLRALGGYVGVSVSPPFFQSVEQVRSAFDVVAAVPFEGRIGFEGIAIGTDFLGVSRTLPGLGNAAEVIAWVQGSFDRPTAKALLHDNAVELLARVTGARLRG
jgi:membrane dipeptidase